MKRRTPLRYVRIQAEPRPARDFGSMARMKAIDVSALAMALFRALRSVRRSPNSIRSP